MGCSPSARVSEQRLQSYTIRWCHNPSANTPSNSHSSNGYDRLSTASNGLKTHECLVHSALNGCLFHWSSLNAIMLRVTTVNGEKEKRLAFRFEDLLQFCFALKVSMLLWKPHSADTFLGLCKSENNSKPPPVRFSARRWSYKSAVVEVAMKTPASSTKAIQGSGWKLVVKAGVLL